MMLFRMKFLALVILAKSMSNRVTFVKRVCQAQVCQADEAGNWDGSNL